MILKKRKTYLNIHLILLAGYALLGKGFAYAGYPPVFVGEVVLLIGMLFSISYISLRKVNPVIVVLVLFLLYNFSIMIVNIDEYGLMSVRDSAVWYYSIYTIILYLIIKDRSNLIVFHVKLAVIFKWIIIVSPIVLLVQKSFLDYIPFWPGSNAPIIWIKPGDVMVFLSGALALHLLKLTTFSKSVLILLLIEIIVFGTLNRGGLLSLIISVLVIILLNPFNKKVTRLISLAILLLSFLWLTELELTIPGNKRIVSYEQIVKNIESITSDSNKDVLEGTKEFRLDWWKTIVDYTVFGEYFYFGKGFGINLADDDGHQVLRDSSLRSPHSVHLTFLARTGVIGLLLWMFLIIFWYVSVFRKYNYFKRINDDTSKSIVIFQIAFLTSFLVNASFDVFLEGPVGGIWFWSIIASGIIIERRKTSYNVQHN